MFDLHHHLLYQLDDGARSFEETQQMLREAYHQGITDIAATTHAVPGREYFDMERYMHHLHMAQEWCVLNGVPVTIHSGAEIFYTSDTVRLLDEGQIPTIAQTNYVLLEFSPKAPFELLYGAAQTLTDSGFDPVFAHIERYECLRRIGNVRKLRDDHHVLMQVNARMALSHKGLLTSLWFKKMMHDGLIDLIASDAHNLTSRKCCMQACFEQISNEYGTRIARTLFETNARRMIES